MTETGGGEFALIARLFAPLTDGDPRALGLADDAAVLPQHDGIDTVVTTDTMVAGVHFLDREAAGVVARRLLRVNLSDLASAGAEPDGYFLNVSLPTAISPSWLEDFAAGLRADQDAFSVTLLGGDTTSTPGPLTLSVTMCGTVPSGAAVRRSGASPGDILFVSGTVGDAALGLGALAASGAGEDSLVARFQLPEPRIGLGIALRGLATAMADVSDGLVADIGHICEASGVAAEFDAARVPLSGPARTAVETGEASVSDLITGGDDYELVFAISPADRDAALAAAAAAAVEITEIGAFREGGGVAVRAPDGGALSLERTGYRHF